MRSESGFPHSNTSIWSVEVYHDLVSASIRASDLASYLERLIPPSSRNIIPSRGRDPTDCRDCVGVCCNLNFVLCVHIERFGGFIRAGRKKCTSILEI